MPQIVLKVQLQEMIISSWKAEKENRRRKNLKKL